MSSRGIATKIKGKSKSKQLPFHLMLIGPVILVAIFSYLPMSGILMAFEKYVPAKGFFGSKWVGLDNFNFIFTMPNFPNVLRNTVVIAVSKIVIGLVVSIVFALLINEIKNTRFKKTAQTVIYLPYFVSWIILAGIFTDLLSPSSGIVNQLLKAFHIEPIYFLSDNTWFPVTMIITDVWKNFGYNTIIYLAALTAIDPTLYEAAMMDGAGRWKQTIYVTLPGIAPIIALTTILSMGSVLNAGFDQIYNMYNPTVYASGDILDTLVFRLGIEEAQYSVSTAVGLFKSVISMILILLSNKLANKLAGYRVL